MNQLILDFPPAAPPAFSAFLGSANRELLHVLQTQPSPFVYLWGEAGAGKSHLLQAWCAQAQARGDHSQYLDATRRPLTPEAAAADYLAVDQAEALDADGQAVLFNAFNRIRQHKQGALLISASLPPAQLPLREDLRTRMGYCLVYEIHPLSDEEKIAALSEMAKQRQLHISPDIFHWLLKHWRRDTDSLLRLLDALDRYAVAQQRTVTLPLLKQLLQQQEQA